MAEINDQLCARAAALMNAGRHGEAIAAYRQLLAADPARADDWYNLGVVLKRARHYADALEAYERALALDIDQPEEVWLNRAVIHAEQLGDAEQAAAELENALALNPSYAPAWLNLGNLHEDRGAREAAREAYAKARAADPNDALALMRLAEVTQFDSVDDPMIGMLRQMAARSDLPAMGRADVNFTLGKVLDGLGAYDEAFAAYAAGNEATTEMAGRPYDPQEAEAQIDALMGAFPDRGDPAPSEEEAPIFILGMFRSGSTLVERILAAHSQVTAGGELEHLPALIGAHLLPYPKAAGGLGSARHAALRGDYLAGLERQKLPVAGLTDKRPDNFLHVGLIKRLFPNAKIVHTMRAPMDNGLSIYFAHLHPSVRYAQRLDSIGHWYGQYVRLMDHWRGLYGEDMIDFSYDALVADPEPEIRRLLDFLGLPFEEACLKPHAVTGVVRTASSWQVREPLYQRSSGRWQNYEQQLAPLQAALGL
ncbi:tetratricopeptide repeat-containing sulfotransferase family protein [Sphingomicrobium flavum]|uniref:tetratricopeptide repeat-containing sulfotransferase family protein n=1 Tax=Sphingomicrobium flavum TaxID=1229164 RepID=UPI0021AE0879|nr:sulfotransferase [Sphingomicrobium flavum]